MPCPRDQNIDGEYKPQDSSVMKVLIMDNETKLEKRQNREKRMVIL